MGNALFNGSRGFTSKPANARREERETASNGNGEEKPKNVFLLDDDPSVLKATSRLLASAGWDVEAFTDAHEFLQHAHRQRPEIAVIDIWMPVMSGLEVQLRLREISPATRVVVLTSKDDPSVRDRALDAGAAGFFLKPVHDGEFIAGLEAAIGRN